MRFDRRAPVIGACIRLHNFCIDKRIEHDMREECDGRYSEVQPSRYQKIPKFDKDGRLFSIHVPEVCQSRAQRGATRKTL